MPHARVLQPTDNLEIAETLARAFQNESGWSYVIPDPQLRARRLVGAFHLFLRDEHRKGAVFGTDGIEAVTLWRGPGQARDSMFDTARNIIPFMQQLRFSIFRGLEVADLIEKHLPKEPVWYLHYAGCDPAFRVRAMAVPQSAPVWNAPIRTACPLIWKRRMSIISLYTKALASP